MTSSLIQTLLAPLTAVQGSTAVMQAPSLAPEMEHLANPEQPSTQKDIILKRFLKQFEYIELDYATKGDLAHPEKPLTYHPHLFFRMCGEDRAKMQPQQINTYLSREIDRGTYLLKSLGIALDDFYINEEKGSLSFDVNIPNPPAGMSEKQALEDITAKLQEACKQARAEAKQKTMAAG